MRYLFSFIQKDRQCESLVEKLCHRFRATRTDRQIRDLAFCLSLLDYSERSIRKLQENLPCFADKLAEDDVYHSFTVIISKTKKFVKPETKALVDELEAKLVECHTKGMNDEEIVLKASQATAAAGKGRKTAQTPGKGLKGKTPVARRHTRLTRDYEDDSDDDFDKRRQSGHPAARGVGGRTSRKPSGGQKGKKIIRPSFSSDEDSDLELFDVKEEDDSTKKKSEGTPNEDSRNGDENIDPNTPPSAKQKRTGKKKLLVMSKGKSGKDSEIPT
ncbi:condensin complex subunit 1-like [Ptychodera flava]|uniref:condensin complex subunit 1-like n=1 Tax=Ptychodera flava TaxID=63121 RepID=UPI00396A6B6D